MKNLKTWAQHRATTLLMVGATLMASPVAAQNTDPAYRDCIMQHLETAADDMRIDQLKALCRDRAPAAVPSGTEPPAGEREAPLEQLSGYERRLAAEDQTRENPFVLTPHNPNYLLFWAYDTSPHGSAFEEAFPDDDVALNDTEVKFQISFKYLLREKLLKGHGDLYFAYTNRSFWQAYNKEISSPFRDTNHEPELWISFKRNATLWGFTNRAIDIGVTHQSNGRGGSLSRSWNRVYANFVFERKNLLLTLKPWYRIPESAGDDDNPDIDEYLGYGELRAIYKYQEHTFSALWRNNLRLDENRGALQLDWSFPLYKRLRGYVQYFNGYGESLLDYDASANSLGLGFQFTDWL